MRQSNGRNERTSFIIVDAQSVKNTDTAEQKGFDGGKLVSGIKRHIGVDTQGLPHMLLVTTANVHPALPDTCVDGTQAQNSRIAPHPDTPAQNAGHSV